jgi:Predicted membrane protein
MKTLWTFEYLPFHPEKRLETALLWPLLSLPWEPTNLIPYPLDPFLLLPYLPQSIGFAFGRQFGLSPLPLMYLGRVFNFSVWIFLMHRAIKTTPIFKWVFCLLALTPMSLFLAASLSYDVFTNAICFLWVAWCLRLALTKELFVDRKKLAWTWLLTLLVALSKHVYVFLSPLIMLIPRSKFGSWKRYFFSIFSVFAIDVATLAFWYFGVMRLNRGASPNPVFAGKLAGLFHEPQAYAKLLFNTLSIQLPSLLQQLLGVLGWLDAPLPGFLYFYLGILILVTALYDNNEISLGWRKKGVIALCMTACAGFIFTAIYLSWSQNSPGTIWGVQGRYFIPLTPLLFLLFYNRKFQPAMKQQGLGIVTLCGLIPSLMLSVLTIIRRYYL